MKKKDTVILNIQNAHFGAESSAYVDDIKVKMKRGIPGQKAEVYIKKLRGNRAEGKIQNIVERSPLEVCPVCQHFDVCGGCIFLSLEYSTQLELKLNALKELFAKEGHYEAEELNIIGSETHREYKNKMEFTFGNEDKDAPLTLGMHMTTKRNSIVYTHNCQIVDEDYRKILICTREYFKDKNLPFYHIMKRQGYLRHLVIRKGKNTGQIQVNLVTTSQIDFDLNEYKEKLLVLNLDGKIVGILNTINDSFSDTVQADEQRILYGSAFFTDKVLGYEFKISPFSFFQTNTWGAEILYKEVQNIARKLLRENKEETVFDLYSGTGTIGILLSNVAKKVISVEIVEEAVNMAKENSVANGVDNVEFVCADVAKEIEKIGETPYLIILDPPRSGLHPKAIADVLKFNPKHIIYVSCNPKMFAKELTEFKNSGYKVKHMTAVDQFPNTAHVETVCLMARTGK